MITNVCLYLLLGYIHGVLEGALRAYENLNGLAAVGRQYSAQNLDMGGGRIYLFYNVIWSYP